MSAEESKTSAADGQSALKRFVITPIDSYFGIILLVAFVIAIGWLLYDIKSSLNIGNKMKEECVATKYYTTGDKGHPTRVYDCSGVAL